MPNQQVEATRQPARLTRIVEAGEVKEPLSKPILVAVAVFTSIGVWTDLRRPLPLRHSAFSIQHSPRRLTPHSFPLSPRLRVAVSPWCVFPPPNSLLAIRHSQLPLANVPITRRILIWGAHTHEHLDTLRPPPPPSPLLSGYMLNSSLAPTARPPPVYVTGRMS